MDSPSRQPLRWIALTATLAIGGGAVTLGARTLGTHLAGDPGASRVAWLTLAGVAAAAGFAGLATGAVLEALAARRVTRLRDAVSRLGDPLDDPGDQPVAISPPDHVLVPLERAVTAARQRVHRTITQLAAESARTRALIDTVFGAVFAVDGGGRVISANAAAARMFGRTHEALVGSVLSDMLAPESLHMTVDTWGTVRVSEAGLAPRFTTSVRLFGRPAFHAEVAIAPLALEGQRAWAVYVHDLTHERMAAAALDDARRAADVANRAKALFLSRMGHELRSPLNSIVSLTRLVTRSRASQLSERDRGQLDRVEGASGQLLALVTDILDLTHIESGGLELMLADTDVAPIVTDVLAGFGDSVSGRPMLLESELPGVPAIAMVDAARLRQVLTHLIGNAVKFTARGSVLVSVRLNHETGRASAILVRDTGIGIALDRQSRIFEKFEQGDEETHARYGGTGLGLALSRGIAQQMRCTLSVESVQGSGSTFTLTFATAGAVPGAALAPVALRGGTPVASAAT
ncbi:MAG: PAS domain S-box protein [Gemmatimonadaceae bacterium]|nr:PAS domain S-box protein [Gemmatimonadaceae bacterium]